MPTDIGASSRSNPLTLDGPAELGLNKKTASKGQDADGKVAFGPQHPNAFDPVQVALQFLNRKLDDAVADIQEMRALLVDPKHQRDEKRLDRIEDAVQEVVASNDSIAETVRSFEAVISVGLVQRVNKLIEERLAVVLDATQRLEHARRSRRFWLFLCAILGALLVLEIHDGRVAVAMETAWGGVSAAMADLGDWLSDVVG